MNPEFYPGAVDPYQAGIRATELTEALRNGNLKAADAVATEITDSTSTTPAIRLIYDAYKQWKEGDRDGGPAPLRQD